MREDGEHVTGLISNFLMIAICRYDHFYFNLIYSNYSALMIRNLMIFQ